MKPPQAELTLSELDVLGCEREIVDAELCAAAGANGELLRRLIEARIQTHGADVLVHRLQFSQKYCRQFMAGPCLMKYVAIQPCG
jgi:hypothetical protein